MAAFRHLLVLCFIFLHTVSGGRHSIKIVEEPSNYGMNFGAGFNAASIDDGNKLKLRTAPANFSGPQHLKILDGKCYSFVTESYKYEFCPFSNITQHEQSLRWNPYSGVIGVWQDWEIENNTFVAMSYDYGDKCGGDISRSAKIVFKCGEKTHIENITEPAKCSYSIQFVTPLVCHSQSMLVYPVLSEELQHEWDLLETRLMNDEITRQGYKVFLRRNVFQKAGLVLDANAREILQETAKRQDEIKQREAEGEYETLEQCTEEFKKLKEQVDGLKQMLEQNGINPQTGIRDDSGPGADDLDHAMNYYHEDDDL